MGTMNEEQPKYDLKEKKEDEYEIRSYASNIAIQTSQVRVEDNRPERGAFMKLAGYIGVGSSPQNESKQAISMTAPVVCVMGAEQKQDEGEMQFILPSGITEPPAPVDGSGVSVVHREKKIMAVRTFSGSRDQEAFDKEKVKLLELLHRDGVQVIEPLTCETYRYNPPWTLAPLRTNEIAIQLPFTSQQEPSTITEHASVVNEEHNSTTGD